MFRTFLVVALCLPTLALARPDRDRVIEAPPVHGMEASVLRDGSLAGTTIFVNRCKGGCTVKPGEDSAPDDTSLIVSQVSTLPEYPISDADWNKFMTCMKEVYSPFNVKLTDVRPASPPYNMIYVAGHGADAGQPQGVEGVAIVSSDCSPRPGGVAYAFAYDNGKEDNGDEVLSLCWTAAQETAHTFGLDHEYEFTDIMQSACSDPMTYRNDCGGQKFFRNHLASCGEFSGPRPACGTTNSCYTQQNSHQRLTQLLGSATPTSTPPMQDIQVPMAGKTVKGSDPVIGYGQAQRGIATVELWINGYKWGSTPGAAFSSAGQPRTPYTVLIPNDVPDSKLDLVLKAFDDIGIEGDSATISVVKGKASGCDPSVQNADGTVDTCLAGQMCTDGKCAWSDANMGEFGDACTYQQFCTGTLECVGTDTQKICTHSCDTSITDSCPMGFSCASTGNGASGVCFTGTGDDGGGCCSVGTNGVPATMLSLATLGLVLRRRKRN